MKPMDAQTQLRALPSVEEILHAINPFVRNSISHELLTETIREEIDLLRKAILTNNPCDASVDTVVNKTLLSLERKNRFSLRPVINATGIIVHTNLGRSVLAEEAIEAVTKVARSYSTLEYNTEEMKRGSRHDHCESLICLLTGAEAAIAVNNNAAAVMMILSEFSADHEAIVSRGEQIEIGGSFRIPDIMEFSNAKMVEVGTTNKTHIRDYEKAINDNTAMLLKVHTSNYRLIGFTESVEAKQLKKLAKKANEERANRDADPLLVYEDLGSGMLLPLEGLTGYEEPTVAEALSQGCDLVSFSGDKLLGGPQAGIIVGSKILIERLKKNPLARALRLDKMTLAALEATLKLYLDPEKAAKQIPTFRMLTASAEETQKAAEILLSKVRASVPSALCKISIEPEVSRSGGGSLPMLDIPSWGVTIEPLKGSAQECASYLVKQRPIPIVARIKQEKIIFNARTLLSENEMDEIALALCEYFKTL